MTYRISTIALALVLLASAAFGQTTTPLAPVVLPTAVSIVGEFNQLASPRFAMGVSALYAPSLQSNIGMYNTTTADVIPVKAVDPKTGKSFYAISASVRQGIHEKVLSTGKFTFLLGADLGPGFSSSTGGGIAVSFTGSFVATAVYHANKYMSFVAPFRMLYINNVGWNPVIQAGVSFNLGNLPAATQ